MPAAAADLIYGQRNTFYQFLPSPLNEVYFRKVHKLCPVALSTPFKFDVSYDTHKHQNSVHTSMSQSIKFPNFHPKLTVYLIHVDIKN